MCAGGITLMGLSWKHGVLYFVIELFIGCGPSVLIERRWSRFLPERGR